MPPARIGEPWWPVLYRALGEELRRLGWPFGDDTFRVHCTYRMRTQYANGSLVFSMDKSACELVP